MARLWEAAPDRDFPRSQVQVRRLLPLVHVRYNLETLYWDLYIQPPRFTAPSLLPLCLSDPRERTLRPSLSLARSIPFVWLTRICPSIQPQF